MYQEVKYTVWAFGVLRPWEGRPPLVINEEEYGRDDGFSTALDLMNEVVPGSQKHPKSTPTTLNMFRRSITLSGVLLGCF